MAVQNRLSRLLIVSPNFPPVNAPDMQRVRTSLPYYREFGWEPYVLAVAPSEAEHVDTQLVETIPADVPVQRVPSLPVQVTRLMGVGNIAIRALPFLYQTGRRLIVTQGIDLVFFSTTMFLSMPLGRVWKRQYGTPYVLDMQDPWVSDYYETHPQAPAPPKYRLARKVHAALEPWTMNEVDGLLAVSSAYIESLRARHPRAATVPSMVLPFGVSAVDFEFVRNRRQPNSFFNQSSSLWHGVYTGAGGNFMAPALRLLFRALSMGLGAAPRLFERVRLYFIGTDYAADHRARKTVEPIARAYGLGEIIQEHTSRVPYFQSLQLMIDADGLILIGSDDPAYMASKLFSYVFARKPIVAVVHKESQMADVLRQAGALVATFGADTDEAQAATLADGWRRLLENGSPGDRPLPAGFESHLARETTRQQCALFDDVVGRRRALAVA